MRKRYLDGTQSENMGLFDIFKKTEAVKPTEANKKAEPAPKPEAILNKPEAAAEPKVLGDPEKTQTISALLAVPREQRNEEWVNRFLADLPQASFRCGTPQLIAGPDGFPYFQLFVPQPGEEYQSYVIEEMISGFLVERGYGVVLNPGAGHPDWVLTYGDLLNYQLNGSFFTLDSLFSNSSNAEENVPEGEEVMVGQPSDLILPAHTRKLLKDFFELNGVANPKVMLMMRKNGENVSQDLAFNITPEGFETETHYRNMMQTVTWYLPRHYSVVGIHEDRVNEGFMPL